MKKTLLIAAAALAIAAGSIGSAETALAQGMMHQGPSMGHRHRVCKPVFKQVTTHIGHRIIIKKVKVGQKCSWVR